MEHAVVHVYHIGLYGACARNSVDVQSCLDTSHLAVAYVVELGEASAEGLERPVVDAVLVQLISLCRRRLSARG